MSIPNLITLGRILLVPVVVWAISSGAMWIAFVLFLAAGVSDAVDGFLAKRFGMTTMLGSYLDPLADKALLVSIYVTLGISGVLPRWLVILVVSKLNTLAQIVLGGVVLGSLGYGLNIPTVTMALMGLVAATTLLSVAAYLSEWMRHMNDAMGKP